MLVKALISKKRLAVTQWIISSSIIFFPQYYCQHSSGTVFTSERKTLSKTKKSPGEPQDGAAEIGVIITKISPKLSTGIDQTLKCTYS